MNPIGLFLGLAILIAVLAIVVRPLAVGPSSGRTSRRAVQPSNSAHRAGEHAALLERRVSIYTAIHELEFEHETAKVSDEEYARQRADLVEDGVAVLMRLDELAAAAASADPLEAAIAAMRQGEEAQIDLDTALEASISGLRANVATNGSQPCPTCGSPVTSHDRFCGNCGTTLETACVECNTPYQVGDLFCAHCGAALEPQG